MKSRGFAMLELLVGLAILSTLFASSFLLVTSLPMSIKSILELIEANWINENNLIQQARQISLSSNGLTKISATSSPLVLYVSGINRERYANDCTIRAENTNLSSSQVFTIPSSTPISTLSVADTILVALSRETLNRTDPVVRLFTIGDSGAITPLAQFDIATTSIYGANAAVLSNGNLYVANATHSNFSTCHEGATCSQLQIVNASSSQLVRSFLLSTSSPPYASGTDGQSSGNAIYYDNSYAFLGLTKNPDPRGDEFNVIDVHDPAHPKWLGGFHIGRTVTNIVVRNMYAYVATDDPNNDLLLLNVHDPAHIQELASFDVPNKSIYSYTQSLAIATDTLYIGRSYAPNQPELLIASIASITSPTLSGSAELGSTTTPESIEGLASNDSFIFSLASSSLDIWDASSPANPILINKLSLPEHSSGTAIVCRQNALYVSSIMPDGGSSISVYTP